MRRKDAIGITLVIVAGLALAGFLASYERRQALRDLEAENARLLEQLDLYREQLRILDTRLGELEALLNLTSALEDTALDGLAPTLVTAGWATGTDPYLLAAICAHESGWGTSELAVSKNNLAGLGAYDCSPGKAMCFDSREECIFYLARLIADGGSLEEIGTWYASDPAWAAKVAGCMKAISEERR